MRADSGQRPPLDSRALFIVALAVLVALAASFVAHFLTSLIYLITNIAFHRRVSFDAVLPVDHALGVAVIAVPVIGGLIVGVMARFGSKAIRGHGIPEAMEQVLLNESRIPVRMTVLKPLSAAIAIGTGGPFGAEGPIIATGGALGSLLGQLISVTADERKTLLAAGAAAGMAATFGSPVSAVLLAIELLLFEYRARSVIPVALAASVATMVRIALTGSAPVFALPDVMQPSSTALAVYIAVGALLGVVSIFVTKLVYWVEDAFEKLPVHWMWWPAIGGVAVGAVGWWVPRTLGVGYANIEDTLQGTVMGWSLIVLCGAKLVSWSLALGSGTSGGTLAPLLTIGSAIGALSTSAFAVLWPGHAIDPRIGALVGMAAIFAGASRALLASVVFAFECTRQPIGLLPLLAGCSASYLVSCLGMTNSIMTEKLARRGLRVNSEYESDALDRLLVADFATTEHIVSIGAESTVDDARALVRQTDGAPTITGPQGFPLVRDGNLIGVVTRRELRDTTLPGASNVMDLVTRTPVTIHREESIRDATNRMAVADVGRLIVVDRDATGRVVGVITRSDLLRAHERALRLQSTRTLALRPMRWPMRRAS